MTKIDEIYKNSMTEISDFVFDNKVAEIFPNMISRSVPGYEFIIKMTGEMSKKFVRENTNCYDLGCSLGASSISVLKNNQNKNFKMIAIDNSEAMIERAGSFADEIFKQKDARLDFVCSNIEDVEYKNASFVISNFSLQFIDLSKRFLLIKKIFDGMNPGAAFLISEKISFSDKKTRRFSE